MVSYRGPRVGPRRRFGEIENAPEGWWYGTKRSKEASDRKFG